MRLRRCAWITWTYLSIRNVYWIFAIAIIASLLTAAFGSFEVATPNAAGEGTTVQFWRLFSVVAGSLPVLTLASSLSDLEAAAGAEFHWYRAMLLVGSFLFSSLLFLSAAAFAGGSTIALSMARALLAWFGLALITGRLLGWAFCWIGPWLALSTLLYWGYDSEADSYRWWEMTAQPPGHLPSLLLSIGLLFVGLAAYALTRWRIFQLFYWVSPHR